MGSEFFLSAVLRVRFEHGKWRGKEGIDGTKEGAGRNFMGKGEGMTGRLEE